MFDQPGRQCNARPVTQCFAKERENVWKRTGMVFYRKVGRPYSGCYYANPRIRRHQSEHRKRVGQNSDVGVEYAEQSIPRAFKCRIVICAETLNALISDHLDRKWIVADREIGSLGNIFREDYAERSADVVSEVIEKRQKEIPLPMADDREHEVAAGH
jgi:hypothetical protein